MVASDHGITFVDYLLIIEIQPCVHPRMLHLFKKAFCLLPSARRSKSLRNQKLDCLGEANSPPAGATLRVIFQRGGNFVTADRVLRTMAGVREERATEGEPAWTLFKCIKKSQVRDG
jgi:hypothetical protein